MVFADQARSVVQARAVTKVTVSEATMPEAMMPGAVMAEAMMPVERAIAVGPIGCNLFFGDHAVGNPEVRGA